MNLIYVIILVGLLTVVCGKWLRLSYVVTNVVSHSHVPNICIQANTYVGHIVNLVSWFGMTKTKCGWRKLHLKHVNGKETSEGVGFGRGTERMLRIEESVRGSTYKETYLDKGGILITASLVTETLEETDRWGVGRDATWLAVWKTVGGSKWYLFPIAWFQMRCWCSFFFVFLFMKCVGSGSYGTWWMGFGP